MEYHIHIMEYHVHILAIISEKKNQPTGVLNTVHIKKWNNAVQMNLFAGMFCRIFVLSSFLESLTFIT